MAAIGVGLAVPSDVDLRRDVRRAARPARWASLSLAVPLIAFLALTFVIPIAWVLLTALGNPEPRQVLPKTYSLLSDWSPGSLPDEPVYAAFAADLRKAHEERTAALLGKRLNYELAGIRSKIVATARRVGSIEKGPWKEALIALDPVWGEPATWTVIARNGGRLTPYYLLTALDLERTPNGGLARAQADQAVFLSLLGRTLWIAALVTLWTLILGYPVAYVLSIAPPSVSRTLMLLVLLPLWTSLLVRTTAWVVLLQTDGVINDALLKLGLVSERLQLIFTRFGTITAMVHIQLPFTLLPIYSVMRTIPATQLRAARSLGAPPLRAFWRVYAPQTLPGVVAGCLMTFILSLGYYITPALVGGAADQMVSNFISLYINRDLNWGLATALGTVLLAVTLVIYWLFLRIVGANRIRLG